MRNEIPEKCKKILEKYYDRQFRGLFYMGLRHVISQIFQVILICLSC